MVARRILVPPVRVRILPRQHKERAKSLRFSSFSIPAHRKMLKIVILTHKNGSADINGTRIFQWLKEQWQSLKQTVKRGFGIR